MDLTTIGIIALSVSMNVIIIKWKYEHHRDADATLDLGLLILVAVVFSGTISGLMIGTIASAIISLYLLVSPPTKLVERIKKLKDNFL